MNHSYCSFDQGLFLGTVGCTGTMMDVEPQQSLVLDQEPVSLKSLCVNSLRRRKAEILDLKESSSKDITKDPEVSLKRGAVKTNSAEEEAAETEVPTLRATKRSKPRTQSGETGNQLHRQSPREHFLLRRTESDRRIAAKALKCKALKMAR